MPCGKLALVLTRHACSGAGVQIAERLGAHVTEVRNVIIWGNHSSSQFPDVAHGTVGGAPIKEAVSDEAWLKGEFVATVQQRGAAIIKVGSARVHAARSCMHA
jgi:malate dehydrogenase